VSQTSLTYRPQVDASDVETLTNIFMMLIARKIKDYSFVRERERLLEGERVGTLCFHSDKEAEAI